ncbi:hypothetical protein ACHAWC_008977 [Mediolabrus comicus]
MPSQTYRREAKLLLEYKFRRLSCAIIGIIFRQQNHNFTLAFRQLSVINETGDCDQFNIKVFIKRDRSQRRVDITDEALVAEIDAIPELTELNRKAAAAAGREVGGNAQQPMRTSTTIDLTNVESDSEVEKEKEKECLCCFVDYPVSDLRHCQNGHGVCGNCIQRYVSEQIDGNGSTDLKCIASGDCGCVYTQSFLAQVLSPGLERRTNELIFRKDVLHALKEDKWNCPGCGYVGFVDKKYPWIHCHVCNKKYCTKCNNEEHGKKTCEQYRKEKLIKADPMHQAHEAMSNACKRSCPKCKVVFVKRDGCNKMKCPNKRCTTQDGTRTYICNLCEDDITQVGYDHFCRSSTCQVSGYKCSSSTCSDKGKCKLWTSVEALGVVDRKRRHDAGRKVLIEKGITDEEKIRDFLQSPPVTKKQRRGSKPPAAADPLRELSQAERQRGVHDILMRQDNPPPAQQFIPPRRQAQAEHAHPLLPADIAQRGVQDIPLRQDNLPPAHANPPRQLPQVRAQPLMTADIAQRGVQGIPMRQGKPPQARRLTPPHRQAPAGANPPRQLPQAELALLPADIAHRGVQDIQIRQDNPPPTRQLTPPRCQAQAQRDQPLLPVDIAQRGVQDIPRIIVTKKQRRGSKPAAANPPRRQAQGQRAQPLMPADIAQRGVQDTPMRQDDPPQVQAERAHPLMTASIAQRGVQGILMRQDNPPRRQAEAQAERAHLHRLVQPRANVIVAAVPNEGAARALPRELIRYDTRQGRVFIWGIDLNTFLFGLYVAMMALYDLRRILTALVTGGIMFRRSYTVKESCLFCLIALITAETIFICSRRRLLLLAVHESEGKLLMIFFR